MTITFIFMHIKMPKFLAFLILFKELKTGISQKSILLQNKPSSVTHETIISIRASFSLYA